MTLAGTKEFKDSALYGIDISTKEIRTAKRLRKKSKVSRSVHFCVGRNDKISYAGRFDLIFAVLSFHEWKNGHKSIPYVLRRLTKEGTLVIYDTMPIDLKNFKIPRNCGYRLSIQKNRELAKVVFYR